MRALLLVAVLAAPLLAQRIDDEVYAERLVDHPLVMVGDLDTAVSDWLDMVEEDPGHPLTEAALRLTSVVRRDVADPMAYAERVLALDGAGLDAAARRQLQIMQTGLRAIRSPVDELEPNPYPDDIARFRLLAPLPPAGRAWTGPDILNDPGFDHPHEGVHGPILWRAIERWPLRPSLKLSESVRPATGWALLATDFDVPAGGPAWLELDTVRAGAIQRRADRTYAWRLNYGKIHVEDMLSELRRARHLAPVVLRTGRNRLMLRVNLELPQGFELRLRVLDAEGRPYPGLTQPRIETDDDGPLGETVQAEPPKVLPPDAVRYLAALDDRGPFGDGLLGWLLTLEGLDPEGLHWLRRAVERRPDRPGLRAVLVQATESAWYLPGVYKRGEARRLAEQVLAESPGHLVMGVFMATLLANEDRDIDALDLHHAAEDPPAGRWRRLMALRQIYRRLGMLALADAALDEAVELAPNAEGLLTELAAHEERSGHPTRALEILQRRRELAGATANQLSELADQLIGLGRLDEAEQLLREIVVRTGGGRFRLAAHLAAAGKREEADFLFMLLAEEFPNWDTPVVRRADLSLARGDRDAETALLTEAVDRGAFRRIVRERLSELTGDADALASFYERYGLNSNDVLAEYDDTGRQDSVVRLIDEALVMVFPDGHFETVTHELRKARDLAGVEELGELRLPGDVLAVRTIKAADGHVYEPVRTNGYVMPFLQPGDYVENIFRTVAPSRRDGVVNLGRWFFASLEEPFLISRYVVSIPKSLNLEIELHNFDAEVATFNEGDAVVHVFEQRNKDRVLPQSSIPPRHWFVPWVEIGNDDDIEAIAARMRAEILPLTWVTPEIAEAAESVVEGLDEQSARARALYDHVNVVLDKRADGGTATEALLMREGNGTILYSALLTAAGVPHDLVWARSYAQDGDPEPNPPFVSQGYWQQRLLIRVRPTDGPEAWCDLGSRTMPYGNMAGDAPRAPAIIIRSGKLIRTPDWPLEERPGVAYEARVEVHADGSADANIRFQWLGGTGFQLKEAFSEMAEAERPAVAGQFAAAALPFIDVTSFAFAGLDDPDRPVSVEVAGTVPAFVGEDGTAGLPLPAIDLGAAFGTEGRRELPFFLEVPLIRRTQTRLELGPGVRLVDFPEDVRIDFDGGYYVLAVGLENEDESGSIWSIRRDIVLGPRVVEPADWAGFAAKCGRIDEIERGRLRFELDRPDSR